MARYPNANWRPVERYQPGGSVCREMATYRRYCLHTAVSNGSLFNWFNTPGNAVAHFYVLAGGSVEQYVDTRFQSTANLEGNHDTISVETEDMGFPFPPWAGGNVPAWTDDQVETLAELGRWVHETHGIPIVACPNSLTGSKGFAYHRQGIDPWRISGGEHWSKSMGKVCPGDKRVAQVDDVIQLAKTGADVPLTDADIEKISNMPISNLITDEAGDTVAMDTVLANDRVRLYRIERGIVALLAKDPANIDTAALLAAIQALPDQVRQTIKDAL